jgi:hypothetical protein
MAHSVNNATTIAIIAEYIATLGFVISIDVESALRFVLQLGFQDFHRRSLLRFGPLSRNSNFVKTF